MGLRIVYVPLWHVPLMMPLRWEIEVEDSEDRRWHQNESRCMEDDSLLNKGMKDDKITVTRNDLHVTTRVIYYACWPVNGIAPEWFTSLADPWTGLAENNTASSWQPFKLHHFMSDRTFHVLRVRHMMRMGIPSNTRVTPVTPTNWMLLSMYSIKL